MWIVITLLAQRLNADKVFQLLKVPAQDNPAVLGTKGLSWETMLKHVPLASGKFAGDRPGTCPRVA